MEFEEVLNSAVVFSVNPAEGLSVMWDPATTMNTTSLQDGGLTVISEMRVTVISEMRVTAALADTSLTLPNTNCLCCFL